MKQVFKKEQIQSTISYDLSDVPNMQVADSEVLIFLRKQREGGLMYKNMLYAFSDKYLNVTTPKTICEYAGVADHYIDLKKYNITDYTEEDFKLFHLLIDVPSILQQERLFRTYVNYYDSYDLIVSCTKYFIEFFKAGKIKVLLTQIVDNYVMDIMCRVARYFKVKVVGLVRFFFEGYVRVTTYGESNYLREASDEEVEKLFNKLSKKTETVFKVKRKDALVNNFKYFFIYFGKYFLHFLWKNKILQKKEYDYYCVPLASHTVKIKTLFPGKYFLNNTKSLLKKGKSEIIYIPIHYFPEATVEYWVDNLNISPYYPSLFETIQRLSQRGYTIVLKEHPAMYQKRDVNFYKKINKIKNAFILNPFISTYEILEYAKYVVVWTGTSGIEAIMQDKKVAAVSNNYYNKDLLPDLENIEKARVFSKTEKDDLLRKILNNCLPLNY